MCRMCCMFECRYPRTTVLRQKRRYRRRCKRSIDPKFLFLYRTFLIACLNCNYRSCGLVTQCIPLYLRKVFLHTIGRNHCTFPRRQGRWNRQ